MHSELEIADHLTTMETARLDGSTGEAAEMSPHGALVFTIHDGHQIPRHLFGERSDLVTSDPEVQRAFIHERDWGANLVAHQLAREIGAGSYLRFNLARVVMDFGRFPGTSSLGAEYLRRHAIYPPLEQLFDEDTKHELLARYYDAASNAFVNHLAHRQITVAVHTYDPHNASGTLRPEVSLVTRSLEYQLSSTLPPYIFDPLFPPDLCEATCQRHLTYRALADLEKDGWHTALNYPYIMPEGSVEIRAQVWFFFSYLRSEFTQAFPETREDAGYQRVWQLLLDVTRRCTDAERLRGFLHRYRDAPRGSERVFSEARRAYGKIRDFLNEHRQRLAAAYQFGGRRLSCLGIEVRKDVLCDIDLQHRSVQLRPDAKEKARRIAGCIAPAVRAYLAEHSRNQEALDSTPVGRSEVSEARFVVS